MINETISILIINDDPDMLEIQALSLALDPAINVRVSSSLEEVRSAGLEPKDYDVVLVAGELIHDPEFKAFENIFLASSVTNVTSLALIGSGDENHAYDETSILSYFEGVIVRPFDPLELSVSVREAHEKTQGKSIG